MCSLHSRRFFFVLAVLLAVRHEKQTKNPEKHSVLGFSIYFECKSSTLNSAHAFDATPTKRTTANNRRLLCIEYNQNRVFRLFLRWFFFRLQLLLLFILPFPFFVLFGIHSQTHSWAMLANYMNPMYKSLIKEWCASVYASISIHRIC